MHAFIVTPGFEDALAAELAGAFTARPAAAPPGLWLGDRCAPEADRAGADDGGAPARDPVFARQILPDAREVSAPSVHRLAEAAYAVVEAAIDAADAPFTLHAYALQDTWPPAPRGPRREDDRGGDREDDRHDERADERADDGSAPAQSAAPARAAVPGLGSRVDLVGRQLLELLRSRRRRAFRHYRAPAPMGNGDGDQVAPGTRLVQLLALDRERLLVSVAEAVALPRGGCDLSPWPGGAAPVTIDRAPPSRAYQKLEEAFHWIGAEPTAGQTCVDLGGAPGGWAYTALKRGALVTAVDRAPLDPPAAGHRGLTALVGNAFTFAPPATQRPVDWLLCDVICEPARSIALIARWLEQRWCRRMIVTIKFKGREGYGALADVRTLFAPNNQDAAKHAAKHARPDAGPGAASGAASESGWRFARVKQLAHNKNEVTVLARER